MSIFYLLMNVIYLASSMQDNTCNYISTLRESPISLEDCKNLTTTDDEQCCVGVQSLMGQNSYFCESYNKTNTEQDISYKIEELINSIKDNNLGAEVKAKASCTQDVTPFIPTKCNIEDTQNSKGISDCSGFEKENQDNYCCLFNGTLEKDKITEKIVQFCYEVNEQQTSNINDVEKKIESGSHMNDISYIKCFPDIPEITDHLNGYFLSQNNIFYYLALILSLIA